jgi:hypothetical protein
MPPNQQVAVETHEVANRTLELLLNTCRLSAKVNALPARDFSEKLLATIAACNGIVVYHPHCRTLARRIDATACCRRCIVLQHVDCLGFGSTEYHIDMGFGMESECFDVRWLMLSAVCFAGDGQRRESCCNDCVADLVPADLVSHRSDQWPFCARVAQRRNVPTNRLGASVLGDRIASVWAKSAVGSQSSQGFARQARGCKSRWYVV